MRNECAAVLCVLLPLSVVVALSLLIVLPFNRHTTLDPLVWERRREEWRLVEDRAEYFDCSFHPTPHQQTEGDAGSSKKVYLHGKYALKFIHTEGESMDLCELSRDECLGRLRDDLLTELYYLHHLRHQAIIPLVGYCIPLTGENIFLVTHRASPLTVVQLASMTWPQRYKIIRTLFDLLVYLEGRSMHMRDWHYQQTMLDWQGNVVFVDLDHIVHHNDNGTTTTLYKLNELFVVPFLRPGTPSTVEREVEEILREMRGEDGVDRLQRLQSLFTQIDDIVGE